MSWFIKYLIVTSLVIWFLVLMSCKHIDCIDCDEDYVLHACPEAGHGSCPICFDTISQNEEVVVLD
jgi:hypothetical protein